MWPSRGGRLIIGWSVLLLALLGWALLHNQFGAVEWLNFNGLVLFSASKLLTLLRLSSEERGRLSWGRFFAYLLWPGLRPQLFLKAADAVPGPALPIVLGGTANLVVGAALLWGAPALLPAETPLIGRVVLGLLGLGWFVFMGVFDCVAALYRWAGVPVEKLWVCPLCATSLADFWGQRWNRIFSGFARDNLFRPLAPVLGARGAAAAVFLFAGFMHDQSWSVPANGGYGLPTLYFAIQCLAMQAESTRLGRALLRRSAFAGRVWAMVVVLLPAPLLLHPPFLLEVAKPALRDWGVPGLE